MKSKHMQCIGCGSEIASHGTSDYRCVSCGMTFPSIDGIGIFLPKPMASLFGFLDEIESAQFAFEKTQAELGEYLDQNPASELSARIRKTLSGMECNLRLLKQQCAPIQNYLNGFSRQEDFLSWASVQTAYSYNHMLGYFYQDWHPTADFVSATSLFERVILEHCRDKASAVVLGAGACGLLHAISGHFGQAIGIDLSLPTLLTAKDLMAGNPLTVHIEKAAWNEAVISPPSKPPYNLTLLVANAMNVPLKNSTASVVLTQHAPEFNTVRLMGEIHRILAPDGLWINLSPGFIFPGDPGVLGGRNLGESLSYIHKRGFSLVDSRIHRFRMHDFESINRESGTVEKNIHFFAARKSTVLDITANSYKSNDPGIWQAIPKMADEQMLSLIQRKTFTGVRIENRMELGIRDYLLPIGGTYYHIADALFSSIDGKRRLSEVYDNLLAQQITLSESEFIEIVGFLAMECGIINYHATDNRLDKPSRYLSTESPPVASRHE